MHSLPFISIIIAVLNEQDFIIDCVKSLIQGSYPMELIEVLIVDGGSSDDTRKVVEQFITSNDADVRLLDNPKKITPAAVNIGIKNAKHDIIVWVGAAHSLYDQLYLQTLVGTLLEEDCASVGGLQSPIAKTKTGKAIAVAIGHKFGTGNAKYRYATVRQSVDTVFGGCWKKRDVEQIGGFNELFVRNQDYEFNCRLREHIGDIILEPKAKCHLFCRETIPRLASQYSQYGFWRYKTYREHASSFGIRQAAPLALLFGLIASAILCLFKSKLGLVIPMVYLACSFLVSLLLSIQHKRIAYLILLPIIFATLHLTWAFGFVRNAFQHAIPQTLTK